MKRALLGLGVLLAVAGPARAQMDSREGIALQNQILELRRDLQTVQAQRGGGVAPPVARGGGGGGTGGGGQLSTELLDRVARLEDQMRQMQGQMDQMANAQRRQGEDLSKQIADLTFKLQNGGGGTQNGGGGGGGPATAAPAQPQATPRRTPELAMQEGNAALARRDYPMAEAAAREVLANGRGPRGTDAQFLLAQALRGRGDNQGAAVAYDDAYNRARTGSRAPDALLGVAASMLALKENPAACATLNKMRVEFPTLRPDVRDTAAAIRARAGC